MSNSKAHLVRVMAEAQIRAGIPTVNGSPKLIIAALDELQAGLDMARDEDACLDIGLKFQEENEKLQAENRQLKVELDVMTQERDYLFQLKEVDDE